MAGKVNGTLSLDHQKFGEFVQKLDEVRIKFDDYVQNSKATLDYLCDEQTMNGSGVEQMQEIWKNCGKKFTTASQNVANLYNNAKSVAEYFGVYTNTTKAKLSAKEDDIKAKEAKSKSAKDALK